MSDHKLMPEDLNKEVYSESDLSRLMSRIKMQWELANPEAYAELGQEVNELAKRAAQSHLETRAALILNQGLDWWTADEIASEAWRWQDKEEPEDEELRQMWGPLLIHSPSGPNE
ncbi:MAG: hypothetical protein ACFLMY_09095 [Candidatus Brachytrichaceae bacterium NZ_4S206]|jgi:hypothetical protein